MGANDRYQIVDAPQKAPGQCFICRSVSRGPFVDTRVDDSFLGVFYICLGCLADMAEAADLTLVPKDQEIVEPEPETESEAYRRGVIAAFRVIEEDVNGYLDSANRDEPYTRDPGDPADAFTKVLPTDPSGQEGSGTSADQPTVEDGESPKRKRSTRVSVDSSDGSGFRV